ncbi:MAG: NADPH:quinone reductase [Geodermatophilaceae bacterium]|nr:NADPH:quinone reductase [Geodermatophilaceae bacterium]
MLAALYRSPGGSEVLSVTDVDTPEPAPGEVRVRLHVAGVNPTDWKRRTTTAPETDFQVPGQDGAGDIDAVGEGVDAGRIGERVWVWFAARPGRRWGSAAQYTVLPSRQAVRLPAGASYADGAGLGVPAMTAWHCLYADGPITGRTVLVAGGAGAVGNAAVALARGGGATVIATASGPDKAALARSAGAHWVVNYRDRDAADEIRAHAPDGVGRIVEVALGANLELDLAVLAPRGVISTYADDALADLPVRRLMVANVSLDFVLIYGISDGALDAAAAGVAAVAADLPRLPVTHFPLVEVAAAHDAVQQGALGKVLLDIP